MGIRSGGWRVTCRVVAVVVGPAAQPASPMNARIDRQEIAFMFPPCRIWSVNSNPLGRQETFRTRGRDRSASFCPWNASEVDEISEGEIIRACSLQNAARQNRQVRKESESDLNHHDVAGPRRCPFYLRLTTVQVSQTGSAHPVSGAVWQ